MLSITYILIHRRCFLYILIDNIRYLLKDCLNHRHHHHHHHIYLKLVSYIVLQSKSNLHQLFTNQPKEVHIKIKEFSFYLQIVLGQLVPSQVLISFFKAATDSIFFSSSFRVSHSIAPLNLKEFIPYLIVLDISGSLLKTFLRKV